jgi:gamma-glutamylcyclotransferase
LTCLYFAYGSNMESATLHGRRGIKPLRALAARASGWRLVFDKPPLVPIGEGFANLVADPAASVLGVLYEVTAEDLHHIDFTEGVLIGNYQRITTAVTPLASPEVEEFAFTLVSDRRDRALVPSRRYMQCLINGAEQHGLPPEYIGFLRSIPAQEESTEAKRLRPMLDGVMRPTGKPK